MVPLFCQAVTPAVLGLREFGVVAGVLGVVMSFVWYLHKQHAVERKEWDERHCKQMDDVLCAHRDERGEWRAEAVETRTAITELTRGVLELKARASGPTSTT